MARLIAVLVALVVVGFGGGAATVWGQGPWTESTPNEQARFLSGLRVADGSVLRGMQGDAAYLEHGSTYAGTWRRFHQKYFAPMRQWAATEVLPRTGSPRVLYYLFGGPDFINAYALFPDVPVYILGGLEPVGSMVPPERLEWPRVLAGLANLRESTSVTLQFSHFITKDMKEELELTDFRGVMPVLMSFVALGGAEILGLELIGIGPAGEVAAPGGVVGPGVLPALRLDFRKGPGLATQRLYYVQADVSDSAFKPGGALGRWMAGFGPATTYLKAASYLLHEPYFGNVRNFLLSNSTAVLQDDSGIPLRFFLNGEWQLTFFGQYSGTLEIFRKYVQPDLAQAYSRGAAYLPFGTGYKWQMGESNLMLAVKGGALGR